MPEDMKFDLPKDQSSIIKVIGVGGGGSNAVNHMFKQGINGVDFLVCNTDQQALDISPVPHKVQIGPSLTDGRGAGSKPEVGRNAAIENIEEIRALLQKNTKMVFITAGMGGGTGTGAAPIIAEAAKELGILTVGIVTLPFMFEGRKRKKQADDGVRSIKEHVDTLLVINNDKLREMYGNLTVADAFAHADNVLTTASKGIAEIITRTGYINVDFEDVRTVMSDGGVAIMGSAQASGDNRALKAAEQALASPLLNDNQIKGARYILLNVSFGTNELLMDEISDITDFVQDEAGETADIIWGYGQDESLGDDISVTLIATGFHGNHEEKTDLGVSKEPEKPRKYNINDDVNTTLTNPLSSPKEASKPEDRKDEHIDEPTLVNPKKEEPKQSSIEFELPLRKKEEPAKKEEPSSEEKEQQTPNEPFLKPKSTDSIKPTIVHRLEDFEEEENAAAPDEDETTKDAVSASSSAKEKEDALSAEDRQRKAEERMMRLKSLSSRLKTPNGIADMENEPAYVRRQVKLDDVPHSSESQVSTYTLSESEDEEGNKKTEIKKNNSFLHDNVD